MKKNLQNIIKLLKEIEPKIKSEFRIKKLEIFGSFVKQTNNAKSDLDILITFTENPSLLQFIRLENLLSERLGVKVDLVMKDSIKPRLRKSILTSTISI